MFALLALALPPPDDGAAAPRLLEPRAICALLAKGNAPRTVTYAFSAKYFADGMHGAGLEIPHCDQPISMILDVDSKAAAKIGRYHEAFREKCGGVLLGDRVAGTFIGRFVRRRIHIQVSGGRHTMMTDVFVISDVVTDDLNIASISCNG